MVKVFGHRGELTYEVPIVDTGRTRESVTAYVGGHGTVREWMREVEVELTTRTVETMYEAHLIIEDTARRMNHMTPLIPLEFEQLAPSDKEYRVSSMLEARIGGVVTYMPASISYMDGIGGGDEDDPSELNVDAADEGLCPTTLELDRSQDDIWRARFKRRPRTSQMLDDYPEDGHPDQVDALTRWRGTGG